MWIDTLAWYNSPIPWIVLIVVLVLFGGQKIPEMMRGLGKGMKEFKEGMKEVDDDELRKDRDKEDRIRSEVEAQVRERMAQESRSQDSKARKDAERELDAR